MAEGNLLAFQDSITCSICLDTLRDPVSILCGHNYCKECLSDFWDQTENCICPKCRETFNPRPVLKKNTQMDDIIEKLRNQWIESPAHVPLCEDHIQAPEKNHNPIPPAPVGNQQMNLCNQIKKTLGSSCRSDQVSICSGGLKGCEIEAPETERAEKQLQMEKSLTEIQKRIEESERKLKEMRQTVNLIKISAEMEVQENAKVFNDLIHSIEETLKKETERIKAQEKIKVEEAEGVMEKLEKEIEELKRRNAEMTELLQTGDHIHFLQTFSSHGFPPEEDIPVTTKFSSENLRKKLNHLKKQVDKINMVETQKITITEVNKAQLSILQSPTPVSREEFLQYSCHLTLNPNTANKRLHLFEENKKVVWMRKNNLFSDHPDRFDSFEQVLCREGLSGGRFYWEVIWNGREAEIGVTYKGISRKGDGDKCLLGYNNKSWCLFCYNYTYCVQHKDERIKITSPRCSRIGVYLDYPAGLLSFYSISDTLTLLHSFQTTFTEPLYPGFGLYFVDSSVTICSLTPQNTHDVKNKKRKCSESINFDV